MSKPTDSLPQTTNEQLPLPTTRADVSELISDLVKPHEVGEDDGEHEFSYPGWSGSYPAFEVPPELEDMVGRSGKVTVHIEGDANYGVALVMTSRGIEPHGFFIQPSQSRPEESHDSFEVWHGPAVQPDKSGVYFGPELLDRETASQATLAETEALMRGLVQSADTASSSSTVQRGLARAAAVIRG